MKKLKLGSEGKTIKEKLKIILENNKALIENAIERGESIIPTIHIDGSITNDSIFDAMADTADCEQTIEDIIKIQLNHNMS